MSALLDDSFEDLLDGLPLVPVPSQPRRRPNLRVVAPSPEAFVGPAAAPLSAPAGAPTAAPAARPAVRPAARPSVAPARALATAPPRSAVRSTPTVSTRDTAPVRLTRRGVVVLSGAVAALAAALIGVAWLSAPAEARRTPVSTVVGNTVAVAPGDTLWSIAGRVAPNRDPRAEVADLQRLNHLAGSALVPGQVLRVH